MFAVIPGSSQKVAEFGVAVAGIMTFSMDYHCSVAKGISVSLRELRKWTERGTCV